MEMRAKAAALLPPGGEGAPSAAQVAAINRWALAALPAEEAYVRQVRLANDAVDRTGERLPLAYLERFAATLPGKPLLMSHDHAAGPVGLWFDATVRPSQPDEPGEWTLEAWFYLRKSPANAELRRQIDAGVIRYASIGFSYAALTCDLCGATALPTAGGACGHRPGHAYDGRTATLTYGGDPQHVEAHEGSLVYLGAQYGAQVEKGVGSRQQAVGSGDKDGISEMASASSELPTAYCLLPTDAALAADGLAYRQVLRDELLRLAGIARAEAEAALLVEALAGQPVAKWLPVLDSFRARVDALLPPPAPVGQANAKLGMRVPPEGRANAEGPLPVMRPVRLG